MMLDRNYDMQREWGLYETEAIPIYRRWISRNSVVYDIGAADGYTALGFATLADAGQVIAFEPDPETCARFTRNLALNPTVAPRISLVPALVGDGARGSQSVDAMSQARGLPRPDFVKMDVEGAEVHVLDGMEATLATAKPVLYIEVHSQELEDKCIEFLRLHAYRPEVIKPRWWRAVYPEYRPSPHNRWLLATPCPVAG